MRGIIFRGQLKSTKEWVYGDLVRLKDGKKEIPHIYGFGEVFPESIGQFTGLYDNTKWDELTTEEQAEFLSPLSGGKRTKDEWKGKPIYENDFVKSDYGYVFIVVYNMGAWMIYDTSSFTINHLNSHHAHLKVYGNVSDEELKG